MNDKIVENDHAKRSQEGESKHINNMSNDISTDNRMWHSNDAEGFKK